MYRFAFLFLLIPVLHDFAAAQSVDEKVFERKSLKSIQKSITKLTDSGYIPVDVMVTPKGRKAMFSARLQKPARPFPWFAEFELTDEQFEKLYLENRAKKMRLVAHEEYTVKKNDYHACIWHFDPEMVVLDAADLAAGAPKPAAQPLGIIWKPDSRIPSIGTLGGTYAPFEEEVIAYMKANQVPSIAIAIAVHNVPVYQAYWGYADVDRKITVKPGHAYGTAWFSRLITSVAVMQLVDKGLIKLDQPVYPLLGIKPWKPATMDTRTKSITIKQLLQQTAGYDSGLTFEPATDPPKVAERMGLKGTVTPDHVIAYMMSQPLGYEPGTKRVPSIYSYLLLGRVIEKVTDMSYEEYVLANVAKPAGITSFALRQTDPDKRPANSVIHYTQSGSFRAKTAGKDIGSWVQSDDGAWDFGLIQASYGWVSSPMDMLAFGTALQAERSPLLSDRAKRILVSMPDFQRQEPNVDKTKIWNAMGLRVRKARAGMDFWMESRGVNSTNAVLCYPSGNMRCFMMNSVNTTGGLDTIKSFGSVAAKFFGEARRLHRKK